MARPDGRKPRAPALRTLFSPRNRCGSSSVMKTGTFASLEVAQETGESSRHSCRSTQ
jgi:hypothetical protein